MELATKAIIEACERLSLSYQSVHPDGNFLRITLPRRDIFVCNGEGDWLPKGHALICKDKDFQYTYLADTGLFPLSRAFCDPRVEDRYQAYVHYQDVDQILDIAEQTFKFPIIVKPNRGSLGRLVQKVETREDLSQSLAAIWDHGSRKYDYIAVIQEYLDIKSEYRVIVINGQVELIYLKDIGEAQFRGNLSPLHWQNARAVIIDDPELIQHIQEGINPIYQKFPLYYGGFDIARTRSGEWKLIEINGNPGFSKLHQSYGLDPIITVYQKLLRGLI